MMKRAVIANRRGGSAIRQRQPPQLHFGARAACTEYFLREEHFFNVRSVGGKMMGKMMQMPRLFWEGQTAS